MGIEVDLGCQVIIESSGVQSVTGDGVGGTDADPVISFPTQSEIGLGKNTPEYYSTGLDFSDIQSACDYCLTTGEDLFLQKNKVYTINKEINTRSAFNIKGNGATLKRADAVFSTLTSSVNKGETVITVADGSKFSNGQKVILLEGTDKQFTHSSEKVNIASIDGNEITLQNPLDNYSSGYNIATYPSGSVLLFTYAVLNSLPEDNEADSTTIDNIIFDGNKANNDIIYTWNVNNHGSITSENTVIRNCSFINMQTEAFFMNVGRMENCYAKDNNGAAIHFGASVKSKNRSFGIVENCYFEDCCEVSLLNNGHNEGVITWSASVTDVEIRNTKVINSQTSFIGELRGDDGTLKVYNCEATNCLTIGIFDNWTATEVRKDVIFSGCRFVGCNDLELRQSDGGNTFGYENFLFENCSFINSGVNFENTNNFKFDACAFDDTTFAFDGSSNLTFEACNFLDSGRLDLSTNHTTTTIDNVIMSNCTSLNTAFRGSSINGWLITGCSLVNTNIYSQYSSVNIVNNVFETESGHNYYASQQTNSSTGGFIVLFQSKSVNISDNKIVNRNTNHFEYAAITGTGTTERAIFSDNYIAGYGHGISYDDNFAEANIQISIVKNNTIILNKATNRSGSFGYCCDSNSFTQVTDNSLFAEPNSIGVIRRKNFGGNTKNIAIISNNVMYKSDNTGSVLSSASNWNGAITNNIYNCSDIPDENTSVGTKFRIFERNTRANYVTTLPSY